MATQQESRLTYRLPDRLLHVTRNSAINAQTRLTNRIAVYGPVRTVVWEGRGREASPYPDWYSHDPSIRQPAFVLAKLQTKLVRISEPFRLTSVE